MIELYTWHDKERRATNSAQDIPFLSTYVTLVTPRIPQIVLHFPCTYAQDCNPTAHTLAHSAYNQGAMERSSSTSTAHLTIRVKHFGDKLH